MRYPVALVLVTTLGLAAPALAGPPGGKPATAGPKTPKAPKAPKAPTASAGVKGTSAQARGPKTTSPAAATAASKGRPAHAAAAAKPPKAGGAPQATATTATTTTTTSARPGKSGKMSTTTTTTGETVVPGPNVPKNPKLQARLQAMLPEGMTLDQAALGFKNQGQFIAAANVATNLGIPFVDLKTAMVDDGLSLGQAIQKLAPTVDGEVESARATRWASQQTSVEPEP